MVREDFSQVLSLYIGLSPNDLRSIMELPAEHVFEHPTYRTLVEGLDIELLKQTLPQARSAYAIGLPAFMRHLERETGLTNISMSTYTLTDWLIRFLEAPETLPVVLSMHQRLTSPIIRNGLPSLLESLDSMAVGRTEWQQALAVMSLPLVAKW